MLATKYVNILINGDDIGIIKTTNANHCTAGRLKNMIENHLELQITKFDDPLPSYESLTADFFMLVSDFVGTDREWEVTSKLTNNSDIHPNIRIW